MRKFLVPRIGMKVVVTTDLYINPKKGDILKVIKYDRGLNGIFTATVRSERDSAVYPGWCLYDNEFAEIDAPSQVSEEELKSAKPWKTVEELTSFLRDRFRGIES